MKHNEALNRIYDNLKSGKCYKRMILRQDGDVELLDVGIYATAKEDLYKQITDGLHMTPEQFEDNHFLCEGRRRERSSHDAFIAWLDNAPTADILRTYNWNII